MAALAVSLASLGAVAGISAGDASASTASPGWQLLAGVGPTHLPPKQSEVQRAVVEGEAGTFTLGERTGEGEGTIGYGDGFVRFTEASDEAVLVFGAGSFEPGEGFVFSSSGKVPLGTEIKEVRKEEVEEEEETILVLSRAASESGISIVDVTSRTLVDASGGPFRVGDTIEGEDIPGGTTVEAVGPETITISTYPSLSGFPEGVLTVALTASERTQSLAYDAAPGLVQSGLEAMPAIGAGSVSVIGGPGGSASNPYLIEFTGSLANQDVPLLSGSGQGLGTHGSVHVRTTVPGGPGTGQIAVFATNIGSQQTSGQITAKIGPLPGGVTVSGEAEGSGWSCTTEAGGQSVVCTSTAGVPALSAEKSLIVPVEVIQSGESSSTAAVSIEGGGGAKVSRQIPIVVSPTPAKAGIQAFWAGAYGEDGKPLTQAGGHPYSAAANFLLTSLRVPNGEIEPVEDLKDTLFDLPPGFAGSPLITKRCPQAISAETFTNSPACTPPEQGVGFLEPLAGTFGQTFIGFPIFNDVPVGGSAAEFTTRVVAPIQSLIGSVRSEEDYGIRIGAPHAAPFEKLFGAYTVLDGRPQSAHGAAFLVNPSDCAQQRTESEEGRGPVIRIATNTWQQPAVYSHAEERPPLLTGCKVLTEAFTGEGPDPASEEPTFTFAPTSSVGSRPVGATAHLHIPQEGLAPDEAPGEPEKLATSDLKTAVVVLPEGLSVNPSSAAGLEGCSEAEIGYLGNNFLSPSPIRFSEAAPSCPDGSKLGTFEIKTPLLEEPLSGTIYLAAQEENPFGSLIALYLVVHSERFGITLKLAGEVHPDPSTGRLTATFDNNPQLPFEDLILHFRGGGGHSELATPEVCGHYATGGALTPWSAEGDQAAAIAEEGFTVSTGCSASAGARPFAPSFQAGTVEAKAGAYSPLVIKVSRNDGEQELTHLNLTLPYGLVGKLAGVGRCSDAQIARAAAVTGRQEKASPSCPSSSLIGTVDVAAGVGGEPFHVPGKAYLAGPYKGAPFSVAVITPAVAGPFDLGDVVVRSPLFIDKATAQVSVKSDAIPTILRGIPLKVRQIAIDMSRPGFTLNPTSCRVMSLTGSVAGASGASHDLSSRFQVGGCSGLAFKPGFTATTKAHHTRRGGAYLQVGVTSGPGQANIQRVHVALPIKLPARNSTLKLACSEAQFAKDPSGCPEGSFVGKAEVTTPLLASTMRGPAIYVSHGGRGFPDLDIVLQGEGITIVLRGNTFINEKGVTTSTFKTVPDVPISTFQLTLPQGSHSALAGFGNFCKRTIVKKKRVKLLRKGHVVHRKGHVVYTTKKIRRKARRSLLMPTTITGQNGVVLEQATRIKVQSCGAAVGKGNHRPKGQGKGKGKGSDHGKAARRHREEKAAPHRKAARGIRALTLD